MDRNGVGKAIFYSLQTAVCLLLLTVFLLVCLSCLSATWPGQPADADEVKLQLKWVHQAQFAGFYLAEEKGYYRDENIKIVLLEGGVDVDIVRRLADGEADFAVIAPETLFIAYEQDRPFTAIAVINQLSPVVYVAKAESGITRPRDFTGKTVAARDTSGSQMDLQIPFYAMMQKLGLDISRVKVVPWDSTYAGFYSGEVDVTPCYCTSALVRMRQKGMKLNLIWPSDYGVHFYSDLIITNGGLARSNPGLVTRFLRASLRGWQDAIGDYQEAVAVSLKYSSNRDVAFQTAMMEAMLPLINTGEVPIGWMKAEAWQEMHNILVGQHILNREIDINGVYTEKFLQEIYRRMPR